MLYAIHCTDRADAGSLRMDARPAHFDYLNSQNDKIVLAGATVSDDGGTMTGSMLIVNVATRAEAETFSNDDPFTKAGLFANVSIQRMRKAIWIPANGDAAE